MEVKTPSPMYHGMDFIFKKYVYITGLNNYCYLWNNSKWHEFLDTVYTLHRVK